MGESITVPVAGRPGLHAEYNLARLRHRLTTRPVPSSLEGWAAFLVATVEELVAIDGSGFRVPLAEFFRMRAPVRFDARLLDPFQLWHSDPTADDARRAPRDEFELLTTLMGGEAGLSHHVTDLTNVLAEAEVPEPNRGLTPTRQRRSSRANAGENR